MSKEEFDMATIIKNNQPILLKLLATGLLLNTAKAKVELYMNKKNSIFKQMIEDEYSYEMLSAYYLEESEELENCARESLRPANEAENIFYASLGDLDGKRQN